MFCHTCGERMIGDGYSVVLHCPNTDVYDVEPDANAVHCYDPVWKNDSMNHPLRIELPSGEFIGQFYNSWDKKYHLAKYTPYEVNPNKYLCGQTGNFSPSRNVHQRSKCECCWDLVEEFIEES